MSDSRWIAEAVVEFLQGPLYINPLMSFIDEKCMIFSPEDENKLEYTPIHEQFQQLVDDLLTDFIEELGVSQETFHEIIAREQNKDKLTGFVVQTILTVDDFMLFKAMMVKRNIDLTNQVLAAVDQMQGKVVQSAAAGGKRDAARNAAEEAAMMQEAIKLSEVVNQTEAQKNRLIQLMRALQLEDEDVAMAIAIANSLRDQVRVDTELAELNEAIALSKALEAEAAAAAAGGGKPSGASAAVMEAASKASGGSSISSFPEPAPLRTAFTPTPTKLDPLAPLKIGKNTAAEQMAALAAAAEANARGLGNYMSNSSKTMQAPSGASKGSVVGSASSSAGGAKGGAFVPDEVDVPAPVPQRMPNAQPGSGRFVPEPLNLGVPKPKKSSDGGNVMVDAERNMTKQNSMGFNRNAVGYKAGGGDDSVRDAAKQAALTQRGVLMAQRDGNDQAQQWLQEQKMKLVAQKKAERQAELLAFREGAAQAPAAAKATNDPMDAKRAELRNKLANKFKTDLVRQSVV